MNLDQFKKDTKTLYARGYIDQRACCNVLGLKEPFGLTLKIVVKCTSWLARKLVTATDPE